MADPTVISVLAFLHIVSAIAWMGGIVFFLSAVGPGVRSFSPAATMEYLAKVGPRQVRFFTAMSTATIVFGLGLLYAVYGSDMSAWPTSIEIGFGLGFIAWLIAMVVTVPTTRKAVRIAKQVMANPGNPPPPEFAGVMRRANLAAVTVVLILIVTAIFMVGTAFPY